MKPVFFPNDDFIVWAAYDEPSETLFVWSMHARFDVYGNVGPEAWVDLQRKPVRKVIIPGTKFDSSLHVYSSARALFEAMDDYGRVVVNRGRGPVFALGSLIHRPISTNPDMMPAIHADEECDGGINHSWLLTEAPGPSGLSLRAFHARHYDGVIVPPDPLIGRGPSR